MDTEMFAFNKPSPQVERYLRRERNGKKTVALVGFAPGSCALAPYNEPNVKLGGNLEIWGLNEEHEWEWFKVWTRWFQLHPKSSFTRKRKRGNELLRHYEWLQEKRDKPIYMQFKYSEIPDSVEYPLEDIVQKYLGKLRRGDKISRYFTNSLSYLIAMALYEGFQRIEIYGFEMAHNTEYVSQKANAEFWLGIALGRGIEVYLPDECSMLAGPLYAYQGQGPRNLMEGSHYDDDKPRDCQIPGGVGAGDSEAERILAKIRNRPTPPGVQRNTKSSKRRNKH
jgi:hypothetical protein